MTVHKILVVDPDENFITFCQSQLEPQGFEIDAASTGSESLALIQENAFDIALVELSLSDLDSSIILHALKEADIPAIVTSVQDNVPAQQMADAIHLGVTALLGKPCEPETLQNIIHDTLKQYASSVVRGNLHDLSLTSLISMLCNEGKVAALDVWYNEQKATLFFDRGQVVHAELDEQIGHEAVYTALTWEEGDFILTMGSTTPEQTIFTSWSGLLLEGLRRVDEAGFDQEMLADEPKPVGDTSFFDDDMPNTSKRIITFDIDDETQTKIEERIAQLYQDLTPRCILFAGHSGRLLHMRGMMDRHEALPLAALVAGSFSAIGEIADMIADRDEEAQFNQSLQEGEHFSLYSAKVRPSWVLAVAFNPEISLGLARQFTLQTAADLEGFLAVAQVAAGKREELSNKMDEVFLTEVSDALGDLFN